MPIQAKVKPYYAKFVSICIISWTLCEMFCVHKMIVIENNLWITSHSWVAFFICNQSHSHQGVKTAFNEQVSISPFVSDSNRLELNEEIKLFRNVREREK